MAEILLNEKNFDAEVLKSTVPTLVDFWAPWCGPCRIQGPIIEELAGEIDVNKAKVAKLNVDEAAAIASQYGIMSIPTLAIFKNGEIVQQFVGVQSKEILKAALDKLAS